MDKISTRLACFLSALLALFLGGCVAPQPQWSVDYSQGCPLDIAVNRYSEGCASWLSRHPSPGVVIPMKPRIYAASLFPDEHFAVPTPDQVEPVAVEYESGDDRAVRRWFLHSPDGLAEREALLDWPNFSLLGYAK